ncbi:MAG: site-specific integrase [Pseudomonadota bacterium]
MIEKVFSRPRVIARLEQGPLGSYVQELAATLLSQGYARSMIKLCINTADKFGCWLHRQGLTVGDADDDTVERYLNGVKRYRSGQQAKAAQGLTHIVGLLRRHGVSAGREPLSPPSEAETWLTRYDHHLKSVAGLAVGTRQNYLRYARYFITHRFGAGSVDWSVLTAQDISDFVLEQAIVRKRAGRKAPVIAIRSLLRFLVFCGVLDTGLEGAVPKIRQWTHAALPQRLTVQELALVLSSAKGETPKDLRDYAILLLLSWLGMRTREVAYLRLDDIDWREGRLFIRPGKTHQERVLPLSQEAGAALADYLQRGRPRSTSRFVFLKSRPPFRPFARAGAVGEIAHAALVRAGLPLSPGMGAHTFRHTVASEMVCHGATFKDVADVLGHRSLQTTAIYAKLDLNTLHEVALPWPGGAS